MRSQWVGGSLVGLAAGGVLAAAVTVVGVAPAGSAESVTTPAPAPAIAPTTVPPPTIPTPPTTVVPPATMLEAPVVDVSPVSTPEAAPTPTQVPAPRARNTAPTTSCADGATGAGPLCAAYQRSPAPGTVADTDPTPVETAVDDVCETDWRPAPLAGCGAGAPRPVRPIEPIEVPERPDIDVVDDPDVFPFDRRASSLD